MWTPTLYRLVRQPVLWNTCHRFVRTLRPSTQQHYRVTDEDSKELNMINDMLLPKMTERENRVSITLLSRSFNADQVVKILEFFRYKNMLHELDPEVIGNSVDFWVKWVAAVFLFAGVSFHFLPTDISLQTKTDEWLASNPRNLIHRTRIWTARLCEIRWPLLTPTCWSSTQSLWLNESIIWRKSDSYPGRGTFGPYFNMVLVFQFWKPD